MPLRQPTYSSSDSIAQLWFSQEALNSGTTWEETNRRLPQGAANSGSNGAGAWGVRASGLYAHSSHTTRRPLLAKGGVNRALLVASVKEPLGTLAPSRARPSFASGGSLPAARPRLSEWKGCGRVKRTEGFVERTECSAQWLEGSANV